MKIIVFAKQVMDPETPQASFRINEATNTVEPVQGIAPVVNGFDENAVEAALKVREKVGDATITVITLGKDLVMDVIKKPLSMGANELILLQDDAFDGSDANSTAYALAQAAKKVGEFDLIICGRQASDTDRSQVGVGVAEFLGIPAITIGKSVDVQDGTVVVERVRTDGSEVVEAPLPALVTVSNELGEPRYPTLRGIMQAGRKTPTVWTAADIDADPSLLGAAGSRVTMTKLFIPKVEKVCEFVEGENGADAGRKLALKLREAKLI
jgi:electron transfer flavoprotein beta subunit